MHKVMLDLNIDKNLPGSIGSVRPTVLCWWTHALAWMVTLFVKNNCQLLCFDNRDDVSYLQRTVSTGFEPSLDWRTQIRRLPSLWGKSAFQFHLEKVSCICKELGLDNWKWWWNGGKTNKETMKLIISTLRNLQF